MADQALLPFIQGYLSSAALAEKDRLLRRLRRLLEGLPAGADGEPRLPAADCREAEHPEGAGLLRLLAGYGRLAACDHPGAEEALEPLIARNEAEQEPHLLYLHSRAVLARALSLSERGLHPRALRHLEGLDPHLQRLSLPALSAEARHLRALSLRRLGRNPEALEEWARALELFQEAGDEFGVAGVEDFLGLAALDLGRMDQAELHFRRALTRKTRLDDRRGLVCSYDNLGRYFAAREQDEQAADWFRKELALCSELGHRLGGMVSLQALARLAWRAGHWNEALEYLERGEELARQSGSRFSAACLSLTRADYHLARGEWEDAEPCHWRSRNLFGPQTGDLLLGLLEHQAAQIAAGRGNATGAENKFIQAREILGRLERPSLLARLEFDWGVWLAREDRLDEAAPHIAQAIAQARSFEAHTMAARFATACAAVGTDHWLQALCRARAMSEALSAEKDRFHQMAETIIHDLKNKMIILNMALKRAETRKERGKDFWRYMALVRGQGLYMENLLKSYLQGLRVEEGQTPDAGRIIELDPILAEMQTVFSVPLEEKDLALVVETRPAGMRFRCNDLFLRLILFNLLDNAIKYTPRGRGAIRLEAWQENTVIGLAVSDPGEGIPEVLLERIFQKWGRPEGPEVSYATGLGLYHTRIMVEALGGRIGVESLVGRGSTFRLHFPPA